MRQGVINVYHGSMSLAEMIVLAKLGELRKPMVGFPLACSCRATNDGFMSMSGEAVKAPLMAGRSAVDREEYRILKTVLVFKSELRLGVSAILLRSK